MKIGIITFCNTKDNYGQVLQAYALQRFLSELGHDVFHIKYIAKPKSLKENLLQAIKRIIMGDISSVTQRFVKKSKASKKKLKKSDQISRGFEEFRNKYIKFTDKEYDQHSILKTPPEADCYITGSDQVWAFPERAYMLGFGKKSIKRIAYAPSLGGRDYTDKYFASEFKKYIRKIDVVTCREEDGAEVCRQLGRTDTEIVPDPVFLLPQKAYYDIITPTKEEGYVLLYLLGAKIDLNVSEIFNWAKERGLRVLYVASQGRSDEYPKGYPNVDEFLGLIQNAKYIITNSFHGMAMSIIFNKNFMVIPISGADGRMNGRITTTLSRFGLKDRISNKTISIVLKEIDYSQINIEINAQREIIENKFNHWLNQ